MDIVYFHGKLSFGPYEDVRIEQSVLLWSRLGGSLSSNLWQISVGELIEIRDVPSSKLLGGVGVGGGGICTDVVLLLFTLKHLYQGNTFGLIFFALVLYHASLSCNYPWSSSFLRKWFLQLTICIKIHAQSLDCSEIRLIPPGSLYKIVKCLD